MNNVDPYQAIAEILSECIPTREAKEYSQFDQGYIWGRKVEIADVAEGLCEYFSQTVPGFDSADFMLVALDGNDW